MTTETTTAYRTTSTDTGSGLLYFVLGAVLIGVVALLVMMG